MKKIEIILSILLVLFLASCATSATTEATTAPEQPATEAPAASTDEVFKVAFLPTDMSATFAAWLASEMETAFEQYPDMELTIIDSKNNLSEQIANLENVITQGYDYVILLPIQPEAEDDLVREYIANGTPIMNINLDSLKVETASSVIAKPYDLGTVVAEYAKAHLPDDANVVVMLGPSGNVDSIERRHAYEDLIFSQTNMTILDEQIGNWYKDEGLQLMENWLQQYGDQIDAVFSMNDAMALGAIEAAKAAGVADNIQFYGVDGLADAAVSINDGELDATALQDAQVMAEEGARITHDVLTGKNTAGLERVQIPVTLITNDNVATFIKRYTDNGMLK